MEKYLVDSIHSEIILDNKLIQELIYSKEVQRLKKIKQLGGAHFIFPSAEHSRYAHSLGVYELVRKIIKKIGVKISELDKEALLSAALLHDIGHGPFSHTLEFLCEGYSHEEYTKKIILSKDSDVNKMLTKRNPKLPGLVVSIIDKSHPIPWYVEIISNQLDADRMDYLTRDSKISGPNYGNVEISRLLNTMMIHDNHLVFKDKSIAAIENFLIGRYHMYEILYMHPKNLGFDQLMIFIFNRLRVMKKNGHRFITNIEILDPIIESKFTTESLYKLTDFSATSIIEELIKEEDVILNKLIDSFQKGKVLKYETLETKAAEESFKKRFKKEEEGFLWIVNSFGSNSIYKTSDEKIDKNSIKILINGEVVDISKKSTIISLLLKEEQKQKKVYGFYYE